MAKLFLLIAAANGLIAVALGAFGAHGLKSRLPEALMSTYQTGVQYHFYHALALLGVSILLLRPLPGPPPGLLVAGGWLLVAGIVLFCGSLYWLALGGPRWLGPVTPLGGLCFILAWLLLLLSAWRL
ncbi:DUF423 domain-containing protein [Exilibacterium tricleocarpae]|uniref:DUF423 domain-containing protein n=1 Tax=Exilibacterium tricleocarpae TaxID=2591008 RepID=A0A545TZ85_9GAMM|nr:DUF423 domain-containing protein [Exilibacterium tricleocarpae]TQV82528.1 DUF423 domain-containing protein [Exilibacterium tricleocarpae]